MKNIKIGLILILSIVLLNSNGQNDNSYRKPFNLQLAVDSINYYEQAIEKTPYFVKENILQIYPGEKLYIEVETKKDEIISMKSVVQNTDPNKTIEIEFKQKTDGKISKMMMLYVKNPFKKKLQYNALMYIVGQDKWIKTSIMPIQPNLLGIETWNDVIISLVLREWRLN